MTHQESKATFERWSQLLRNWDFNPDKETFENLIMAYSERVRHYHTVEHLSSCFHHLDKFNGSLQFSREVELAIWFHDAIYNPFSTKNEMESASWAATFLEKHGASEDEIKRVKSLILATKHYFPTKTIDEAVLVDIDLSILGSDSETYGRFEKGVRMEYKFVPWFLYRKKRRSLLRSFLGRKRIYINEFFFKSFEHLARENLANAISNL